MTEIRAVYKGRDFKANPDGNDTYVLISSTPVDGFEKYENKDSLSYFKEHVPSSELELYKVCYMCEYQGKPFECRVKNRNVILETSDPSSVKKFGFTSPSPGYYWKTVSKDEVTNLATKKMSVYPITNKTPEHTNDNVLKVLNMLIISGARTYHKIMKKARKVDSTRSIEIEFN